MSLLQVIRCCLLIVYCSTVIIFIVCLHVPAASYTLLFANRVLQHGNYFYLVLTCPCCKVYVVVCLS